MQQALVTTVVRQTAPERQRPLELKEYYSQTPKLNFAKYFSKGVKFRLHFSKGLKKSDVRLRVHRLGIHRCTLQLQPTSY